MKSIILFLLIVGIIFCAVAYVKSNQQCPPPQTVFRYVPRTFEESQNSEEPVMSIFGSMFRDLTAWDLSQGYAYGYPRSVTVNKHYLD